MTQKFNFEQIMLSGKHVYRCRVCGKTYKIVGPQLEAHAKTHEENMMNTPTQPSIPRGGSRNYVTREEYQALKRIIAASETPSQAVRASGRSWPTVIAARGTESFEDFRAYNIERGRSKRKTLPERSDIPLAKPAAEMGMDELIAALKARKGQQGTAERMMQSDYELLKEMFFRGEVLNDIRTIAGRSDRTLGRVRESKDYQDYLSSIWVKRDRDTTQPTPKAKTTEPLHYSRLKEFREGLDRVLIDFIKAEMEEGQKLLMNRIEELESQVANLQMENKGLRHQLERTDFTKALKDSLERKEASHGV